jgi:hypothetical protein
MLRRLALLPILMLAAAAAPTLADSSLSHLVASATAGAIGLVVICVLGLAGVFIYFLPAFLAFKREHPARVAILVVNFFFGVTFLGWIICLIWALASPTVIVVNQAPPGPRA